MNYKRLSVYLVTSIGLCAQWGCATRKYQRSEVLAGFPEQYRITDTHTIYQGPDSSIAAIPYQDFFTEPELRALIEKAVKQNYNLQIAVKQIQYAEETVKHAKMGYAPNLSATVGSATIDRPSDVSLNGTMYDQFLGRKYLESYSSSVALSWTADIWGKIKQQKKEALAAYLETEEAKKAVQTQLVSGVAQGYYNLLMLREQDAVTKRTVSLYDSTISMTIALQESGEVNELSVQQQKAARQAAVASLPVIEQQMVVQQNALSILLGEAPRDIQVGTHLFDAKLKDNLPTGIPASMVDNRPDVQQAELDILRSIAAENVAHVSMYPQLSISGNGGINANELSKWFTLPGALFVNGLANITTPILNGRQLKTSYNQAKINTDEAILKFKNTVLTALSDVSNSMSNIVKMETQENEIVRQVDILTGAVENARLLYQNGMANYLEVISAESNLLQARLNRANVRRQRLSETVLLYQSLGGGWK